MPSRDMTKKQFDAACARRGFVAQGFMGYYKLGNTGLSVSILNTPKSRRAALAYLIQSHDKEVIANKKRNGETQ